MPSKISVRCSSLPRLFSCPNSVLNPDALASAGEANDAASLGHLVHKLVEMYVKGTGQADLVPILSMIQDADERRRAERMAHAAFAVIADLTSQAKVTPLAETYLCHDIIDGRVELTGTLDLHVPLPQAEHLIVCDFKTGRLQDDHTHQMMGYCWLLLRKYPWARTVNINVCYLDSGATHQTDVSWLQADAWADMLRTQLGNGGYAINQYCRVCPLAATCPAVKAIDARVQTLAEVPVTFRDLSPADKALAWDKLRALESAVASAIKAVKNLAREHGEIDLGTRKLVVETKTVRSVDAAKALPALRAWLPEDELESVMAFGLPDLVRLARSKVPTGQKGLAEAIVLERLGAVGAITTTQHDEVWCRTKK